MPRYEYRSKRRSVTPVKKKIHPLELGTIQDPPPKKKNERRERDKIALPFWCQFFLLPMLLILLLIGVAIAIFSMVRYIPSTTQLTTTTTSMTTTTRFLNWNATGLTLAGMTNVIGTSANQFNVPVDLSFDSSNNMYIADYYNSRIQRWLVGASNGTTVAGFGNGSFGNTAHALYSPVGLLLDSQNRIFIGDSGNHRVQLYLNGASSGTTIAGTTGVSNSTNTTLYHPYGVVYDSTTNRIYIAEFLNHRISSYIVGASSGTVVAGGNGPGTNTNQLSGPVALFLDKLTNSLLICNFDAHTIVRWVLGASNWTLLAGTPGVNGTTSTLLNGPRSVTLDSMGNMYVADSNNHRVQFFEAGQSIGRTIAGVTGVSGSAANLLSRPYTVRLDSQLNLYVTDSFNHRIQKFFVY